MKSVAILGSTGTIGKNALEVIAHLGPGYAAHSLACRRSVGELLKQTRRFAPRRVALFDHASAAEFKKRCNGRPEVLSGMEGLSALAADSQADIVVCSLVGAVGLIPLVCALKAGKKVALANKEPMVMAGPLLMQEARRWRAEIIPVDSEPSAIFQCLQGGRLQREQIRRVILTASGGPFYRRKGNLSGVSVEEALAHPNWKMGKKITVDSATLMNKGFEAIEIAHLFGLKMEQIEILIHPQSILHSAVEMLDGSVLAQMSCPDMKLPIQYALTYPAHSPSPVPRLDWIAMKRLEFDRPDFKKFPCLPLCLEAARLGGGAPAALSAANEIAVEAFLEKRIGFMDIPKVDEKILKLCGASGPVSLQDVVEIDQWARDKAREAAMRL